MYTKVDVHVTSLIYIPLDPKGRLYKLKHLSIQTDLHLKDARLEQLVDRNQQLTAQVKDKDEELQIRNANMSRLRGEVQTLQVTIIIPWWITAVCTKLL